jgi:hypothetical protein
LTTLGWSSFFRIAISRLTSLESSLAAPPDVMPAAAAAAATAAAAAAAAAWLLLLAALPPCCCVGSAAAAEAAAAAAATEVADTERRAPLRRPVRGRCSVRSRQLRFIICVWHTWQGVVQSRQMA